MANTADPFDALANELAGSQAQQSQAQDSQGVDPFDAAVANLKPKDPYEEKVKDYMPEAREYYKKSDPLITSIKEGAQRGIIGDVGNEIGADIEAALPSSLTGLKGDSYLDRRQDFKARSEALTRAGTEKSDVGAAIGEIGGAFALPMGGIAGATEEAVAGAAPSLGKFIPKVIGMGTEGGIYAGGTALVNNLIGTQPASESPSILGDTLVGAGIGAALPGIGKVVGYGAEKVLPEWAKSMLSRDPNYFSNQFLKQVDADEAAGEKVLGIQGAVDAVNNGQNILPFDMGGTRTQKWLQKTFKNNPDALENFQSIINQRLSGTGADFDAAMREAAGITEPFNLDKLNKASQQYAKDLNNQNYQAAFAPDNGVGTWFDRWGSKMNDPDALDAVKETNDYFSRKNKAPFVSPIGRKGSMPIAELGLTPQTESALDKFGFKTIDDVFNTKPNDFVSVFQPPEMPSNAAALERQGFPPGFLKENPDQIDQLANVMGLTPQVPPVTIKPETQQALNEIKKALQGINPNQIALVNPDTINIEYLHQLKDSLQKRIDQNYSEPVKGAVFGQRLSDLRDDIVGSITGRIKNNKTPNKYYNSETYNPAYDRANKQAYQNFRQDGAFETGRKFLNNLTNGLKVSGNLNEVAGMNKIEHNMFAQGILGEILNKSMVRNIYTQEPELKYNLVKKYFSNPSISQALENALGPVKFAKLENSVKLIGIAHESADNAAKLVKTSSGESGSLIKKDILPAIASFLLDTKLPLAGILYNHVFDPILSKQYATKVNSMLTSGNILEMSKAYDLLMSNQKIKTPLLNTVAHLSALNIPNINRSFNQTYRASGGRVGYKDGGATYGLGMGSGPTQPHALLKPEKDPGKVGLISKETMENAKNSAKLGTIHWEKPVSDQETIVQNTIRHRLNDFDIKERAKRATGGRIPEADKLFKVAKREMDNNTKPLLNAHDDHIVHALRIAQGRI